MEVLRVLAGETPPRWGKAVYKAVFLFPDARRRDPDNCIASLKAYLDGIADAGLVANDCDLWPVRPEIRQCARISRMPRVEITITEEKIE